MGRCAISSLFVAVVCLPAFAQTPEVPPTIRQTYQQLHTALHQGDRDGAAALLDEASALFTVLDGKGAESLLSLPDECAMECLEATFIDCVAAAGLARVEYDLHIRGVEVAGGEDVDRTERRVDWLRRSGDDWRLLRSLRVDAALQGEIVSAHEVRDGEFGVALPIPDGWQARVLEAGMARQVCLLGPDPSTAIVLFVEEYAAAPDQSEAGDLLGHVMPLLNGSAKLHRRGPIPLGGREAHQVQYTLEMADLVLQHRQAEHVAAETVGATAYGLSLTSADAEAFAQSEPVFDTLLGRLAFTERRPTPLPPEMGTLTEGRYLNADSRARLDLPPGWLGRLIRSGREPWTLAATRPGTDNELVFCCVEVGRWIDPQETLKMNVEGAAELGAGLAVLSEGPIELEDASGYQMVVEGTREGGKTYTAWEAYIMRANTLFVLAGEVRPKDGYEGIKADWESILRSLRLGPAALED